MVDSTRKLIDEIETLEKEIRQFKKEMPDIEKYQAYYKLKIIEATRKVTEIRKHVEGLDLKNRRCDK